MAVDAEKSSLSLISALVVLHTHFRNPVLAQDWTTIDAEIGLLSLIPAIIDLIFYDGNAKCLRYYRLSIQIEIARLNQISPFIPLHLLSSKPVCIICRPTVCRKK